jgi:hypothetical protein
MKTKKLHFWLDDLLSGDLADVVRPGWLVADL